MERDRMAFMKKYDEDRKAYNFAVATLAVFIFLFGAVVGYLLRAWIHA